VCKFEFVGYLKNIRQRRRRLNQESLRDVPLASKIPDKNEASTPLLLYFKKKDSSPTSAALSYIIPI
jgi:hypothetical protein